MSNDEPRTFTYKTIGNTDIKADVYRLAGEDVRPVILWIHGGALIVGNRKMLSGDQRDRFLRAGYVVVAIDYRLAPETRLPEKPGCLPNPQPSGADDPSRCFSPCWPNFVTTSFLEFCRHGN